MGYFIRYKDLGIHIFIQKWNHNLDHKIINISGDDHWDRLCRQYPYANCVKTDLILQLTGKNLQRTIPKSVKMLILDIPIIKSLLREDKINSILNG